MGFLGNVSMWVYGYNTDISKLFTVTSECITVLSLVQKCINTCTWSGTLCLILHCQSKGVFQEDILQVVGVSTNKLSLAFSQCCFFFMLNTLNKPSKCFCLQHFPHVETVNKTLFQVRRHTQTKVVHPWFTYTLYFVFPKYTYSNIHWKYTQFIGEERRPRYSSPVHKKCYLEGVGIWVL